MRAPIESIKICPTLKTCIYICVGSDNSVVKGSRVSVSFLKEPLGGISCAHIVIG